MSNFRGRAVHPKTLEAEEATFIDHGTHFTIIFDDGTEVADSREPNYSNPK